MTLLEFRTKAYELLTANGHEEINGEIYFPESSIMDMLEWMIQNTGKLPTSEGGEIEKILETINRAFKKIAGE